MTRKKPKTIYLKDYKPPAYRISAVDLHFDLTDNGALVKSRLECSLTDSDQSSPPLVLNGKELELISLAIDGHALCGNEYKTDEETLTIFKVPSLFSLEIVTRLKPHENTSLEGLYCTSGNFCTQCEAQGFRKITYFADRPDVMARYTTTIIADRDKCPVLLSNGNLVKSGELPDNRHFAEFKDPFPKPCYLFALVAGDLAMIEDKFVTCSGRTVSLQIYVQRHNRDKCGHAMASLKKAMRWDEEVFGLEYDLDQYMIVAVDDFNMGAMENKGLNIFNSKYVLASFDTATDDDYKGIESVIAHEYFHNWTGNRVTCRDWFQLSLKEGLTVFRDQEFSADMSSRTVKRIGDVKMLRNRQFPEDSGPMAHPVRPDSYIEINNFYTMTVYEKGGEVVRMIHTILGRERFQKGMDLYFKRHDGQAVTTDDFVQAMEDAGSETGKVDFSQFRLWYSQAGTPEVTVSAAYDSDLRTYSLTLKQKTGPTPGQPEKEPLHIPMAIGLIGKDGKDMPLQLEGESGPFPETTRIFDFTRKEQTFNFVNLSCEPVPSFLRGFSAPVKLDFDYTDHDLRFLLANESDSFNRWEAGQRLDIRMIMSRIDDFIQSGRLMPAKSFMDVFRGILEDDTLNDHKFTTLLLTLPSEEYLAEFMDMIDVDAIHEVRQFIRAALASELRDLFLSVYHANVTPGPYSYDAGKAGQRRLKNLCLSYLMILDDEHVRKICVKQYQEADNMTDALNALQALVHGFDCPEKEEALASFYERWKADPLVLDKWFAIQATAPLSDTMTRVKRLMNHPAFSIKNPNKVRSLLGAFCGANQVCYHNRSGEGYVFLADRVLELDRLNPQIAARLLGNLSRWRRYDKKRQKLMKKQLKRILGRDKLSGDVYEVAEKSLKKT